MIRYSAVSSKSTDFEAQLSLFNNMVDKPYIIKIYDPDSEKVEEITGFTFDNITHEIILYSDAA